MVNVKDPAALRHPPLNTPSLLTATVEADVFIFLNYFIIQFEFHQSM